jgi:hypothetical protein
MSTICSSATRNQVLLPFVPSCLGNHDPLEAGIAHCRNALPNPVSPVNATIQSIELVPLSKPYPDSSPATDIGQRQVLPVLKSKLCSAGAAISTQ